MARFLTIAPHPDDAELGMGGTLLTLAAAGHECHILDLTTGEPTPRGSEEIRAREKSAASEALGIGRTCLGLKNREVVHDLPSRHKLAAFLREYRPDVMFVPFHPDAHPDHRAAYHLAVDARFDAKLTKSDIPGEPWWPRVLIQYYCTHLKVAIDPTFCVDVSDQFERKVKACACYESQGLGMEGGLIEFVRTMHGYFGGRIGTRYAEPFFTNEVLGLTGLDQLAINDGRPSGSR